MDPVTCYLDMFSAMQRHDYELARERALELRDWLENGGFYPPTYGKAEVESYLTSVLRRTAELVG